MPHSLEDEQNQHYHCQLHMIFTSVSNCGGLYLYLRLQTAGSIAPSFVEDDQPPRLALLEVRLLKLGGLWTAVGLKLLGVPSLGDEDMRPLPAAVALAGAVLARRQRPPVELYLSPPAGVSLEV